MTRRSDREPRIRVQRQARDSAPRTRVGVRLGHEPFYRVRADGEDAPVQHGRVRFFVEITRLAPAVLASLRTHVLPVYRTVVQLCPRSHLEYWKAVAAARPGFREHLLPLQTAVHHWADCWHLSEPWVLEVTPATLRQWAETGEIARGWHLAFVSRPLTQAEEKTIHTAQRRHRRVTLPPGIARAPVRHTPEPYRWLVRHQVLGESAKRIVGGRDQPDPRTVRQVISDTAASIGLRLRRLPPGPPPRKRPT